jgi:hypothetical protein
MNEKNRRLITEFGPDTRFEVRPAPEAPFRALSEDRFEHLKARLLRESLAHDLESKLNSQLRRAANEAAALAWLTHYPLLVFPVLFEEKALAVFNVAARQKRIREQSCELLAL